MIFTDHTHLLFYFNLLFIPPVVLKISSRSQKLNKLFTVRQWRFCLNWCFTDRRADGLLGGWAGGWTDGPTDRQTNKSYKMTLRSKYLYNFDTHSRTHAYKHKISYIMRTEMKTNIPFRILKNPRIAKSSASNIRILSSEIICFCLII